MDVADERFAAVLEGDTRFGIDRTDAGFKVGTASMISFLDPFSVSYVKSVRFIEARNHPIMFDFCFCYNPTCFWGVDPPKFHGG